MAYLSVETLALPDDFFRLVTEKIKLSKRRIVLSALYLGVELEREKILLDTLTGALTNESLLEVSMIFDFSRSMRSRSSILHTLGPLVSRFKGRLKVYLYRMPQVEDSLITLPSPIDEVTAVYHCKFLVSSATFLLIYIYCSHLTSL